MMKKFNKGELLMKNNEAEERLLNNASIEDLIKMKIERELMEDQKKSKQKV